MSRSANGFSHGLCGAVRNFSDAYALHPLPEGVTVDCIAVAKEVGRRGIVWEGVDDLLTQGQILEGQLAVAAQEEGEKAKQVE
jgi:hypothetical protein